MGPWEVHRGGHTRHIFVVLVLSRPVSKCRKAPSLYIVVSSETLAVPSTARQH